MAHKHSLSVVSKPEDLVALVKRISLQSGVAEDQVGEVLVTLLETYEFYIYKKDVAGQAIDVPLYVPYHL